MGKGNSIISDKEIDKIISKAIKYTAEELHYEIETVYENIIDRFYSDYNPIFYERTYNTYTASSAYHNTLRRINPIRGTWKDINGRVRKNRRIYDVGIIVDSGFMQYEYDAPWGNNWVFQRTWQKGIHGTENILHTIKPKKEMDNTFKKINTQKHIDEIMNKNLKQQLDKYFRR